MTLDMNMNNNVCVNITTITTEIIHSNCDIEIDNSMSDKNSMSYRLFPSSITVTSLSLFLYETFSFLLAPSCLIFHVFML